MGKAIALGVTGAVISVGMLGLGYLVGSGGAGLPERSPAPAAASQPLPVATADRGAVEAIVRDYLVANPEILLEVQQALEIKQQEQQRVAQTEVISGMSGQLFNAAHDGVVGNPEGDVTIVEFFDYNCGYCKRALADMEALVAADPQLRFVLKELPILGPDSQQAHIVSMAFRSLAPEKYGDFHRELLGSGRANEATAIKVALAQGVDETQLREAMKDPAIAKAFGETYTLANELSITGTPSYVVGNEVVFGALGQETLAEKIEAARALTN
ncbi:DsbA family protein [Aquamicrobium sp. LC103]|uniref:DsbA family protein n=1 Tax=Aquamicrobium sp. LC103 TaxID=1120658 RepID=UPI00063E9DD2|nr:DsbA family protein [Aquamicrobium sp. LC103]TKT79206.1 DsbA family protein [Aquamicrobium sp. LC103]